MGSPEASEDRQSLNEVTRCPIKTLSASVAANTGRQTREVSLGDNVLERALHSSPSSCQILPRLRLTEDGVRCICEKRSPLEYGFVLLAE